jgi:DNA modification methylase
MSHEPMEHGLQIETVAIDSVLPADANPRAHPDANMAAIMMSLVEFGQVEPIILQASSGKIIAGHGRLDGMKRLKWTHCKVARVDVNDNEAQALAVALNRSGELATWDDKVLADLVSDLDSEGYDLSVLGFDSKELVRLLAASQAAEATSQNNPDEVPAEPAVAIAQPGDVWILGRHRVVCGDSTRPDVLYELMGNARAGLLLTDPPYGLWVSWNGLQEFRGNEQVANDDLSEDDWGAWASAAFALWCGTSLAENASGYWWYGHRLNPLSIVESLGWKRHATIIWVKEHFNVGRGDYQSQYEPCLYFSRGERHWCGRRDLSDVWDARRVEDMREHPNQKPTSLFVRSIECSLAEGGLVFDPFLGSGTTVIAAEKTGRTCYGCELEPKFVDVIVNRWQAFTGGIAIRNTPSGEQ